jgi:serine/threonine-protein kinase
MADTPDRPAAPSAEPPARRRGALRSLRALFGTLAIAFVAFLTGLYLFDEVVMPRFTGQGGDLAVPDLSNLTRPQAEAELARLGLRLAVGSERFDPAVPRGFVITQDPAAGRLVKQGRRVSVAISLGEEFANIPDLFGESLRGARLLLNRAGLANGSIGRVITSEVGPGLIVASEPPFGAVVARGTRVNLLVCVASEPEAFVMPDLVGRDVQAVARDLEALGFRVDTVGPGQNLARIGAQEPAPGARVVRGQIIRLTVAGRLIQ